MPLFVVWTVFWPIITSIDVLISHSDDKKTQAWWNSLWHPHLTWHTWLIGVAVAFALVIFEGSYRHSKEKDGELDTLKTRVKHLEDQRPQLRLPIFSDSGRAQWTAAVNAGVSPARFQLENVGGRVANQIRFDPIPSKNGQYSLLLRYVDFIQPNRLLTVEFDLTLNGNQVAPWLLRSMGQGQILTQFLSDTDLGPQARQDTYEVMIRFKDQGDECVQRYVMTFDILAWSLSSKQLSSSCTPTPESQ